LFSRSLFDNKLCSKPNLDRVPEKFSNIFLSSTFDEAKKTAKSLDKKLNNGETLGELAGVPVTIKVNTDQIGYASTNGLRIQNSLHNQHYGVLLA